MRSFFSIVSIKKKRAVNSRKKRKEASKPKRGKLKNQRKEINIKLLIKAAFLFFKSFSKSRKKTAAESTPLKAEINLKLKFEMPKILNEKSMR